MDFKKTGMFVVGLVASSILLLFCFLKYKNREKAITSTAPKVDYKFSDENRNLVPFFHLIKDYEKEIENSKISVKTDLLNIIRFVKGHTTDRQEVEKSLNNLKKERSISFILKYKADKFPPFFKSLLENVICVEEWGEISYRKMKEKNTLDLFNRFGFYLTDFSGNDTEYFICLKYLHNCSISFIKDTNIISVNYSQCNSWEYEKYPPNIILILDDILFNFSLDCLKFISYKNFPDLEITLGRSKVSYQPSEFIFKIDEENEQIFCCKSKEGFEFYDSNGIIEKFDSNKKLTQVAIKYSKESQK